MVSKAVPKPDSSPRGSKRKRADEEDSFSTPPNNKPPYPFMPQATSAAFNNQRQATPTPSPAHDGDKNGPPQDSRLETKPYTPKTHFKCPQCAHTAHHSAFAPTEGPNKETEIPSMPEVPSTASTARAGAAPTVASSQVPEPMTDSDRYNKLQSLLTVGGYCKYLLDRVRKVQEENPGAEEPPIPSNINKLIKKLELEGQNPGIYTAAIERCMSIWRGQIREALPNLTEDLESKYNAKSFLKAIRTYKERCSEAHPSLEQSSRLPTAARQRRIMKDMEKVTNDLPESSQYQAIIHFWQLDKLKDDELKK
ncbi:uncharacterized protein DSM5745_02509 [Aspergillus mulundensis]|uniref:Uncharacterized protein n=1 Tax=Aspergillus mulundensis TaxID=1810919 RepID=A0A3D8SWT1_9EURO|nr:hypothetical protein DSM5745_02509 [Aspergillus mulundensis]RDW90734.1 hypothetical protein DSM5745_02509 [Aspergillus mulundensis]